jgi:hypothetical protein
MHLHIVGIGGTFMGGIAALARAAGHRVTGCDRSVYPPMSTQLEALGIDLIEGYTPEQLALRPDVFVIGNVMSRGNPLVEAILDAGCRYGPATCSRVGGCSGWPARTARPRPRACSPGSSSTPASSPGSSSAACRSTSA